MKDITRKQTFSLIAVVGIAAAAAAAVVYLSNSNKTVGSVLKTK